MEPYRRRVSANEKLYLAAERLRPGFCIQLVVDGDGAIDEDALRDAIARASDANPGARLVLRGVLGWMRWEALGPAPALRRLGGPGWTGDEPPPSELERPLPPDRGPTCEVVITGPARLVFRCFHGVMDARGLLHFAEDVFRALRGEAPVGSDGAQSDTELILDLAGARPRPDVASDRLSPTGRRAGTGPSLVHWRRVELRRPTPALVARLGAALATYAGRSHGEATRVMIPVDLRNYRRGLRATGNLTCPLLLDVAPGTPWQQVQQAVLKGLAARDPLRLFPGERVAVWLPLAILQLGYGWWMRGHRRTGRYPFSALVTHVSLQGLGELGGGRFRAGTAHFLPPQSDFIPLAVAAVSTAGWAQIVVSAPIALVTDAELDAVSEALAAALE